MALLSKNKDFSPFILKVLFWFEVVLSLRMLLFITPYTMTSLQNDMYKVTNINNWFIMVLTFICLQYFVIGIASLGSHIFWILFHYLGVGMAIVLTLSLVWLAHYMKVPLDSLYYIPLMFSIMLTLAVFLLKEKLSLI